MTSRLLGRFAVGLCLALLTACGSTRLADLNAVSTRDVNLDRIDLDTLPGEVIEGESSAFIFLFIPFGSPTLQDAVDDALDKSNGDLMVDAVAYQSSWWFLIGQSKITIKGTVVDTHGGN